MPHATGPERIRRILDDESRALASGAQNMVTGLTQKSGDQEFRVRSAGFKGLSDLRGYYRELQRDVEGVQTKSPRKGEVVAALSAFRASLKDFDRALRDTSDNRVKLLKQAAKRSKSAAKMLDDARDRL